MGSVKPPRPASENVAYIKGPEIDIPEITLTEMFNAAAQGNDNRFALDFMGKKTTYAELDAASDRVARGLQDQGFKKGDKVVFYMPNSSYYPIMRLGVWKAGGTVVNILPNTLKEIDEEFDVHSGKVRDILQRTQAPFIVTLDIPEYLHVCDNATFATKAQNVIVCPMAKALPPVKEMAYPILMGTKPFREKIHDKLQDLRTDVKENWNAFTWENTKDFLRFTRDEARDGLKGFRDGLADLAQTAKILALDTGRGQRLDYLRYTQNRYFPAHAKKELVKTPQHTRPVFEKIGVPDLDFWSMTSNDGLYEKQNLKPSDVAILQTTSGTTGTPKLAMLTHRNVTANVLQSIYQYTGQLQVDPHGNKREIIANPIPFGTTFSSVIGELYPLMTGAELATVPDPKNTDAILSMIHRTKATALLAVPKIIMNMAEFKSTPRYNISALHTAIIGGDELAENVTRGFEEVTGLEGVLHAGYGTTETSPVISSNSGRYGNKPGTIGHLFANMEARIVSNDGTGRIENRGVPGKLQVRGPNIMLGYFNNQAETDKVLSEDGWLDVGDNCIINKDGSITFYGREKRMADINGLKVFHQPVEAKLQSESSVAEAVVITVADSRSSQALKAIVRLREGVNESEATERLKAYLQQSLGKLSAPKHFEFVKDPLPKTNAGKADWRALQDEHYNRHIEKQDAPAPSV